MKTVSCGFVNFVLFFTGNNFILKRLRVFLVNMHKGSVVKADKTFSKYENVAKFILRVAN